MGDQVDRGVLDEMRDYYRARAPEYDDWFLRRGRYDRSPETNRRWFVEVDEVVAALERAGLGGDALELAAGTGIWTERLLPQVASLTAVDASPEMIALNLARVGQDRVRYIQTDLFTWQPDRQYDAVFFGFWISHVPRERLDAFLRIVATALHPGGKLFFVDGRREPTSTAVDHQLPMPDAQIMTRRLDDGREFQIVKIFYEPSELATAFERAGLVVEVRETAAYFIYGAGTRTVRSTIDAKPLPNLPGEDI